MRRDRLDLENRTPARVLLVEDNERIAGWLARALSAEGSEAVVAEDGEVALFLTATERFDAIVLDLTLPGISGLEVLERIKRDELPPPVVVLTGCDDPASRRAALDAGASAFVTKPLVFEELGATLRELVAGRCVA